MIVLTRKQGQKIFIESKQETVLDVLPSLDLRRVITAEEKYLAEKHGGAEGPDELSPERNPRHRDY